MAPEIGGRARRRADPAPAFAVLAAGALALSSILAPESAGADTEKKLRITDYRTEKIAVQTEEGRFSGRIDRTELPAPPVPVTGVNERGALRIEMSKDGATKVLFLDRFDVEIEPKARTREKVCELLRRQQAGADAGEGRSPSHRTHASMGLGGGCAKDDGR